MDNRILIVAAAFAISLPQCKSAAPGAPAAAEPTPASLFEPPLEMPSPQLAEPIAQPILPLPDGGRALYELGDDEPERCPLALAGVVLEAEEVPNGMALVFRTEGDDDETDRVQTVARRFYEDLVKAPEPELTPLWSVRATMTFSDAPGGALIVFVPKDLEQVEWLRSEVRASEQAMEEARACLARVPSTIELVPR